MTPRDELFLEVGGRPRIRRFCLRVGGAGIERFLAEFKKPPFRGEFVTHLKGFVRSMNSFSHLQRLRLPLGWQRRQQTFGIQWVFPTPLYVLMT